jgi:hypothetical protein
MTILRAFQEENKSTSCQAFATITVVVDFANAMNESNVLIDQLPTPAGHV